MNEFLKDYDSLLRIAGTVITKTRCFNIEPEEMLSEAYIYFETQKTKFSIKAVQNYFYEYCYKLKQQPLEVELTRIGKKQVFEETKVCVKCKEDKPIAAFSFKQNSHQKFHSYCKECNKNDCKERRTKKKEYNNKKQEFFNAKFNSLCFKKYVSL